MAQLLGMSIVVDLDQLAETLAEYPFGYLLTIGGEAVKAVTVTATVEDDLVVIPTTSNGSARNLATNSAATLLFPPPRPRGYSLIIDGAAAADGTGFHLEPTRAVLHRPADHSDEALPGPEDATCSNDCLDL